MKKFRLLLMMSSLLALVCSFTACNTDIADDYPSVSISLTAGEATSSSVSFTIKASGADDIYYWVVTAEDDVELTELNIDKASYLDAQVDLEFEQVVTKSSLKASTEYHIYAYAVNFAHNGYSNSISMTTSAATVAAPLATVSVIKVDEDELTDTSFLMWVGTTNAAKASWLVVPKYTEGVTAAKVLSEGVALAASQLNKAEVAVTVEDLTPDTEYDFYLAAENVEGKQVISDVVAVTTAPKVIPVVEVELTELMNTTDLSVAGLPGIWTMLMNPTTGDGVTLFAYNLDAEYPGYLANGEYPLLSGSFDNGTLPNATCVLADPGYTSFSVGGVDYYPIGDLGADEEGNVYGITVMTAMPESDENYIEFNIPAEDLSGNQVIIRGSYYGPLGYVTSIATWPFDLAQWSFTKFEATANGNNVVLKSNSINGEFVMNLTTENGAIEGTYIVGENLAGGFTSFLEGAPEFYEFVSGRIALIKGDAEGQYTLAVSTRGDEWIMVGESGAYKIDAKDYDITITAAAPTLSVDAKRWALPTSFALATVGQEATCFVDMGVSLAGKLLVGADLESVYGPDAAGYAQAIIAPMDYTVEALDATSGNIKIAAVDHFGDVVNIALPYSNLTAESVTIDFTNMLGSAGVTTCDCTLFTKEILSIQ